MKRNGLTCQSFVEKEVIAKKCAQSWWIEYNICGKKCAKHGFTTNPECHTGTHFDINHKSCFNFNIYINFYIFI